MIQEVPVSFETSHQLKLSGIVYRSSTLEADKKYPAIVLCQGLSGVKHLVLPEIAARFANEGFICLAFDYRGFGESEGERGYIDPYARTEDALHAFRFIRHFPDVNSFRVGIYGLSLGGGIAACAAAQDPLIKAVVSVSGFYSGEHLLRSLRTTQEWIQFKDRLAQNETKGKEGERVLLQEIFPFDASFLKKYQKLKKGDESSSFPETKKGNDKWYLASADRLRSFNLLPLLKSIAPRPLLMIHAERDNVIPVEDVQEAYQHTERIRELIVLSGLDHIDLDNGSGLDIQVSYSTQWFKQYL